MSRARRILEKLIGEPCASYGGEEGIEHIVSAAMRDSVTGDIYLGEYHDKCRGLILSAGTAANVHSFEEGFYTSEDRFVSRREAVEVARRARQFHSARALHPLMVYQSVTGWGNRAQTHDELCA